MPLRFFLPSLKQNAKYWILGVTGLVLIVGSFLYYNSFQKHHSHKKKTDYSFDAPPSAVRQSSTPDRNQSLPYSEVSRSGNKGAPHNLSPIQPIWTTLQTIDQSALQLDEEPAYTVRRRLVQVEEMARPIIIEDLISNDRPNLEPRFLNAYSANRLLVRSSILIDELLAKAKIDQNWKVVRPIGKSGYHLIETSTLLLRNLQLAEAALSLVDSSTQVEKDLIYYASVKTMPNDPEFGKNLQWGLSNSLNNGMDINALEGWTLRSDASSTIVAIIDTGTNLEHLDLLPNLWRNESEIADNKIDDDGNGFVDDVFGISLLDTGDPVDDNGHGTHVAGIVGARGNNGQGTTGVAWRARLMTIKFLNESGRGTLADAVEAIDYAIEMGARVLNASWGSYEEADALREAIVRAGQAGGVLVTSAGNDGYNLNDSFPYPASYDLENLVSVGALQKNGTLAGFSNYGTRSVDIAAPGQDILSTWTGSKNAYSTISGTSMAAPFVSGILALLYSEFPDDSPELQIARLVTSGKPVGSLNERIRSGKIPDLEAALAMAVVPIPPELSSSLESVVYSETGETVTFEVEDRNKNISDTSYQWYHNGNPLAGQNSLTLEILSSEKTSGKYHIEATNIDGADKIVFDLRIFVPQPALATALDFPGGNFLADTGHNWTVYEDPLAKGGTAIRKNVSKIERQDSLRLSVDGPGELRLHYRQFSQSRRRYVDILIDDEKSRIYPEFQWQKITLPIYKTGTQTIAWKTDDSFSRPVGQAEEIALDSVVFFPADSLPPNIRFYWSSRSFREGSNLDLRFEVDYEVTQYQWLKDGVPFAVTQGPRLRIENVANTDAGTYQLIATNQYGSDRSIPIVVEISPGPPRFLNQSNDSISKTLNEGDRLILAPEYTGSFELSFQWYHWGDPLPGATSPTLAIDPVTPFDLGRYSLEIWYPSTGESARSQDYWLHIRPARSKPDISLNLFYRHAVEEGQSITLNTEVQGSTPISYQWYRDNVPVPKATHKDLTLENASLTDAGTYYLIARNQFGVARSEDADITVFPKPDLTELLDTDFSWIEPYADIVRPVFDSGLKGGGALRMEPQTQYSSSTYGIGFTVNTLGTFRMRIYTAPAIHKSIYHEDTLRISVANSFWGAWQLVDGWLDVSLPIVESPSNISINIKREDAEYFLLDAFSIDTAPIILRSPLDATTEIGMETRLQVVASGMGPFLYQWYKDGLPIEGATDSEHVIPTTQISDQGAYYVTASNTDGSVTSVEATLTVIEDLESLLALEDVVVTSGGDAPWSLLSETLTLSSGTAKTDFFNWIEFAVTGPTFLNFEYKGTGTNLQLDGGWYDHLQNYGDWGTMSVTIPEGNHTVRLEYFAQPQGTPPFLVRNLRNESHSEFKAHPQDLTMHSESYQYLLSSEVRLPIPSSYQWYKDGIAIPQGFDPNPQKTYAELVIGGNSQLGPGVYHCEAVYPGGGKAVSQSATVFSFEESFGEFIDAVTDTPSSILLSSEYAVDWKVDRETFVTGGSSMRVDSNSSFRFVAPSGGVLSFWAKTEGLTELNTFNSGNRLTQNADLSNSHDWIRYEFLLDSHNEDERTVYLWARFRDDTPATLWLDDVQLSTKPLFKRQPESIQTRLGESVKITPELHSISPLSYQWHKDGAPIPGARSRVLSLSQVSADSLGNYELVATNSSGTTRSRVAEISLQVPLNQAVDNPNLAINTGGHASWSTTKDEWQFHGSSLVSPPLEKGQVSYIEFQVVGPVEIGLFAKPVEGTERAFATVYADGNREEPIHRIEAWNNGWSFNWFRINEAGISTIRIEAANTEYIDPNIVDSQRLLIDRILLRYPAYSKYYDWIEEQTRNTINPSAYSLDPLADANSNGIANLLDYLFVENTPRPASIELKMDGPSPYYNIEATLRHDYEYDVQFESSTDLKNWTPSAPFTVEDSIPSDPATQVLNWRVFPNPGKTLFFRWRAFGPEGGLSPPITPASTPAKK